MKGRILTIDVIHTAGEYVAKPVRPIMDSKSRGHMKRLKVARKATRAKAFRMAVVTVNRKHDKTLKVLAQK